MSASSPRYLDTSALVKLYVPEPETPLIQAEVLTATALILSWFGILELRAALLGKARRGEVLLAQAQAAIALFETDLGMYRVLPVDSDDYKVAGELLDRYLVSEGLRGPDALHLAVAIREVRREPLTALVTTDMSQKAVGAKEGLIILP